MIIAKIFETKKTLMTNVKPAIIIAVVELYFFFVSL
jgi:hypothetical protein